MRERERDYYVDVDNVRGGKDATTYLIERGHHRIATITGPLTMPAGVDRLRGYRDALAAHGLPEGIDRGRQLHRGRRCDGDAADPRQRRAPRRDLRRERPHGPRRARPSSPRAGIRVPDDIAIMGFDDSPVATSVTPQLTTMRQPSFAQGERMATVLLDLLAGRHPRHVTILETELVVRDSV